MKKDITEFVLLSTIRNGKLGFNSVCLLLDREVEKYFEFLTISF